MIRSLGLLVSLSVGWSVGWFLWFLSCFPQRKLKYQWSKKFLFDNVVRYICQICIKASMKSWRANIVENLWRAGIHFSREYDKSKHCVMPIVSLEANKMIMSISKCVILLCPFSVMMEQMDNHCYEHDENSSCSFFFISLPLSLFFITLFL